MIEINTSNLPPTPVSNPDLSPVPLHNPDLSPIGEPRQKEFVMQNRSEDIIKRARAEAKAQYDRDFQNQNLFGRWGMRAMEDFYIDRNTRRLIELKRDNNNSFATMNVAQEVAAEHGRGGHVVGASHNVDANRAEYNAEGQSSIERARQEYNQLLTGSAMTQESRNVVAADSGGVVKQEIMQNLINHVTATTTPEVMQNMMRQFTQNFINRCNNPADALYAHRNDADVQNFIQRFGVRSHDLQSLAEGSADVFAAPEAFLHLAQEVKADMAAHNLAIADMDKYVTIVLSNPRWAQATETQLTWRDRFISRVQRTPVVAHVLTPQVASVLGYLGGIALSSSARRGATTLAVAATHSSLAGWMAGTVVGTTIAAARRWYETKKDITAHRIAMSYNEQAPQQPPVPQQPRRGLGRLAQRATEWVVSRRPVQTLLAWGEAQRQERLAATIYDMASVDQMINGGGEQLYYSEAERAAHQRESIAELIARASTDDASRDAVARRAGEIIARLDLYTHGIIERNGLIGGEHQVRKDVIQWKKRGSEEGEKQQLNEGLQALREALISKGNLSAEDATDRINAFRDNWRGVLEQDIVEKDLEARHHQVVETMFAAGYSILGSATFGVLSHEAMQGAMATINAAREHVPSAFGGPVNVNISSELASSAVDHHEVSFGNVSMHVDTQGQVIFDKLNDYHGPIPKIHIENGHMIVADNLKDPKFHGFIESLPKGVNLQEHYVSAALQQGLAEKPIPPIGDIPAGAEHINIPAETHWQLDHGHYNLVTKDGVTLMQNAHVQDGHITADVINHNLINIDPHGNFEKIETSQFLNENKAKIDGWQWYGNNTQGSDFDELKLYDNKVSSSAIHLNMLSMEDSWQNGNYPPNAHVPDVVAQNRAVFTFWNQDNLKEPLIVRAQHGQLTLDKNDWKHTVQLWNGHQWVEKPNAEVANLVVGDINSGYESASNFSGHTEAWNYNVSAGALDGNTMSSYATALGTGTPPHDIPTPIEHITAKPHAPEIWVVQDPSVLLTREPTPIDFDIWLPMSVGPRHIPESKIVPPPPPPPRRPEINSYYEGEPFTEGVRRIADIMTTDEDINSTKQNYGYDGTPFEREIDKAKSERAQELAKDAYLNADAIYFVLSEGPIGDAIVASGYFQAVKESLSKQGKNVPITLVVSPSMLDLFKPLESNSVKVITKKGSESLYNQAENNALQESYQTPLILDFSKYSRGKINVKTVGNTTNASQKKITTINNLLGASIELYNNQVDSEYRYSHLVEDLFSMQKDSIDPDKAQPRLTLPTNKDQLYAEMVRNYGIDVTKPQISIVVEASEVGKRYSIDNWMSVMTQILVVHPDVQFNIIYNSRTTVRGFTQNEISNKINSNRLLSNATHLVSGSFQEIESLFEHQKLVLGNDTGLVHIAGAIENGPKVASIFLPRVFSANHWVSSRRQQGISLDPPLAAALPSDSDPIHQTDENRKWINRIPPQQVAGTALNLL